MRRACRIGLIAVLAACSLLGYAENPGKDIKRAVERSTLDQPGTKPFHLKALITTSFERDKDSGRTGEVEIWWWSPTRWKRDVRSPQFHQVMITDGPSVWQKNEGEFFPQWLEQTAVELVRPIPLLNEVLAHVKDAETRNIGPMTHVSWTTESGTAEVHNILRSSVAVQDNTGLILYAGGLGWGGEFKDYVDFHGRMVAHTVNVGSPQVTAKVMTLEDLGEVPAGFFDKDPKEGDPPLRTVVIDEISLRKNLLPMTTVSWPSVQDGALEGNVTTHVVVDREGKVRDVGTMVSENPAVNEAGRDAAMHMQFKPFLVDGVAMQVLSQFTIPFKTTRPAGTESFESARIYFERGRHTGFPAFGNGTPYVLHAEFDAKGRDGTVIKGQYEDAWLNENQWRREASFDKSRFARSKSREKNYRLADGQDAGLLQLVFRILEPIPAIDTFVESDWRIKRDTVNETKAIRVLTGYESPEGKLDPEHARGYWFDDKGLLLKTFFDGIETVRSEFQDFAGVKAARRIDVLKDGKLALRIRVVDLSPAGPVSDQNFEMKGHEWTRAFTSEAR